MRYPRWSCSRGRRFVSVDIQRGNTKSCCPRLRLGTDHAWGVVLHGEGKECCVSRTGDCIEVFGGDVEGEIDEALTVGFEERREAGLAQMNSH